MVFPWLQEAEERWRKEYQESLKMQEQSHWLHVQAAEEKARAPWPGELERRHKQQAWSIGAVQPRCTDQVSLWGSGKGI